ncbi:MAG: hypothetical protein Q4C45_05555 [Oscillospiraceae bacterium]|nr:hypothetical protein [Oscillospiraceae bacterium]
MEQRRPDSPGGVVSKRKEGEDERKALADIMVNKIGTMLYYDQVNSLLNPGFTAGGQAERQAQQHRGTDETPP